jgi:hypothetical protein
MSFQGNGRKIAAVTLIVGIAAFVVALPFAVKGKTRVTEAKRLPSLKNVPAQNGFAPFKMPQANFLINDHQEWTH